MNTLNWFSDLQNGFNNSGKFGEVGADIILLIIGSVLTLSVQYLSRFTKKKEKLSEVISTDAELIRARQNTKDVILKISNSSNEKKSFRLDVEVIDGGDCKNRLKKIMKVFLVDKEIEMAASSHQKVEVARLFSPSGGPGKAICLVNIESLNGKETFRREIPLN